MAPIASQRLEAWWDVRQLELSTADFQRRLHQVDEAVCIGAIFLNHREAVLRRDNLTFRLTRRP